MNQNSINLSLAAYFNDIVLYFYEDTSLVESMGREFGFDINKDIFLAMSFLYPSDTVVEYDAKKQLQDILAPTVQCGPINRTIDSQQFLLADKGVSLFLIGPNKSELIDDSKILTEQALELIHTNLPNARIRIGIGTPETGLAGIVTSFRHAIQAVTTGEKFKNKREVLDYISMEIYSAINAMVIAYGENLIGTIIKQLTDEEQLILGKYYKCKENVADTAKGLSLSEDEVLRCFEQIKNRIGLDVNDTEDNFKLNFIMIAKRVLEKEKKKR